MISFEELNLDAALLRAVAAEGYTEPTPIQTQAIPPVLEGRDLMGCAQTGTGKTAAFALPILHRLIHGKQPPKGRRPVRVLVLTPTRELATQIGDSFAAYGRNTGLRHAVIFGGVKQGAQVDALRCGVDILVATPGRLIDLAQQGFIRFNAIEVFVLDEADRMLDMGFIHDVRRIEKLIPKDRQTLLFSATLLPEVRELAGAILNDPLSVAVDPPASTVDLIGQRLYFVEKPDKAALLTHLMRDPDMDRVLVFTRTKYGADKVCRHLRRSGIKADAIHGNKSQNAREGALADFKRGRIRALVATDIASRGIDVDGVSHVINYDLPYEPESYVHRIGRTGRAGMKGLAIAFCDETERKLLPAIERLMQKWIPVAQDDYPFRSPMKPPMPTVLEPGRRTGAGNAPSHRQTPRPQQQRPASFGRSQSGYRRKPGAARPAPGNR